MTPQERTELQRLAVHDTSTEEGVLGWAREIIRWKDSGHDTLGVEIMASALLSLVAQSEELRAELETAKEHLEKESASRLRWQDAHEALGAAMEERGEELDELRADLEKERAENEALSRAWLERTESLEMERAQLRTEMDLRTKDTALLRRDLEESSALHAIRDLGKEPTLTSRLAQAESERDSALESRRILESRYTALVAAVRELIAHLDANGPNPGFYARCKTLRDALGALLDSEASDQGGNK